MKCTPIAAIGLVALSACAQAPEAISPVSMPSGMYDHLSCASARAERANISARLTGLESAQRSAATGDAIGVFLIGVPTSSLTGGDKAGELATEKGKALAIDARLARC